MCTYYFISLTVLLFAYFLSILTAVHGCSIVYQWLDAAGLS